VLEGDLVTAVVTASGTYQAEIMGIGPTVNKVTWSSIDIWRVKDGKITDVWHNFPNEDILQQIGYTLVPPTK
jgi:predicted ester cyclase